ncbi:hypothetical protein [Psychroflexus tropicus]|uniref:hypothetical protein n=1 Tax=Psychroflexus tropicus TaxID=197345 RepID=UPI000379763E|nr:hypothetical protein [Psychroflexus tropicus]
MEKEDSSKAELKGKLKTVNAIFYSVLVAWLILVGLILYKFIIGKDTTAPFLGTIPIIAILIILGQLKSKMRKEIDSH